MMLSLALSRHIPAACTTTSTVQLSVYIGRGLDARPGRMGGGAMEINTVPRFESTDAKGVTYSKFPKLQFPVDDKGRILLVQDVTYYSKAALYDAFKAWRDGGPATRPYKVNLADGSTVTYSWYRFVDQPSFQQYKWSEAKKAKLQAFVEKIHANWPIDRDYMAPPTSGQLAALDPALLVTLPKGMEVGCVAVVTRQEDAGN